MLTIFTPTYNRAYILPKLYDSLIKQSSKDFEWIIVDDGSADHTEDIVKEWINDKKITIRYFKQANKGKPSAHNRGVQEAQGNLFVCVDSDDYLREDTVFVILNTWNKIKTSEIVGILAFRAHQGGKPITTLKDARVKKSRLRDAYKRHGLRGDTMLVYKTDIIRKYQFPVIESEKFIPEGYLYNKIDKEGALYILREYLYICEYRNDGYTQNVAQLLFDNYKSYAFHLMERINNVDKGFEVYLDLVRYVSVMCAHSESKIIRNSGHAGLALLAYFPGVLLGKYRYGNLSKKEKMQANKS